MFILGFFSFLRCSELTITSLFYPSIHPTISDLQIIDNESMSFFIKQSKTNRDKKGHFVYIFSISKLQSNRTMHFLITCSTNFFNYLSTSKSPLDPLFTKTPIIQLRDSGSKSILKQSSSNPASQQSI